MSRLLNRRRPPVTDSSPARAGPSASLPRYQPPSCPLNDRARRALGELSDNRGTLSYETHLKDSARHLGLSVGDLHERLRAQIDRLQLLQERREQKGTSKTPEEERLEAHLVELERDVDELTHESEQSIRDVIDHRAEIEDQSALLRDLYTAAATATAPNTAQSRAHRDTRHEPTSDGEQDLEQKQDAEAVASTLEAFRKGRASKQAEYQQLTAYQRYGVNNDYAGFKKIWHDAASGHDGPPLPDASRWFRPDGRPVMTRPGANTRRSTAGPAGDDDDIAVAREVLSLNCPLSLRQMEEPYSNVKCKHTFDKSAIWDYLSTARGEVQCPQTGCCQKFSKASFQQEFYLDEAILRRIQRVMHTQRSLNDMDVEDDEDADQDASLVLGQERRVPGRTPKTERL
ncbi:Zinc finger, RING/FYVE/PHD-type [Metarhizium album ARSEF 1941]|uniref:Zinc finger, RING/FYVE/PHD-type n=1 Tax=Metarhizium album (strain ARSEF 1941) TaxID=1081103 RepID=A0A0B2X8U6_METAS|nr:Zinc finger, RING/FYVE/PHD-type [Metarhizium album ARSEF 1941]KHO01716.1 Zinc finger, RING/FYVE/PHD-type [Metarhizium album ARSEF 1941]